MRAGALAVLAVLGGCMVGPDYQRPEVSTPGAFRYEPKAAAQPVLALGRTNITILVSVSLKLRNKTDKELSSIQINAIFRRVGEQEMWGEYFGWAIPRTQPLPAGESTRTLVMRSTLGYTGDQPRMQMLQNKEFVDAKVEIYLKQGSKVLAKLAEYPIQRQLITRTSQESLAPKSP